MKRILDSKVREIKLLNDDTYIIDLQLDELPQQIEAGNFAEVRVDNTPEVFLRRPLSIFSVDYEKKTIGFFVKIIGKGTYKLSTQDLGSKVNIIYPLGNEFSCPQNKKVLIIGGGSGIAPLVMLGKKHKEAGNDVTFLLGARSSNDIHIVDQFEQYGKVLITTEDGSLGEKGRVTDHPVFQNIKAFSNFFTCGPDAMMKALGKIAQANDIECEVSLENTMACGIGACLVCVTETTTGNRCVCTEGPVFNVNELKW